MRRVIVAGGAALLAVGLLLATVLLRPGTAVGTNVFVNPPGIIDAYSTPTIVGVL